MTVRALCLALLLGAIAAHASPPTASATFGKREPNTEEMIPIKSASFADKVHFLLEGSATDGDHMLEVVIYDASGREVYQSRSTVTAKGGRWGATVSYGFHAGRDMPGEWWYVATLDDESFASESIQIADDAAR